MYTTQYSERDTFHTHAIRCDIAIFCVFFISSFTASRLLCISVRLSENVRNARVLFFIGHTVFFVYGTVCPRCVN